MCNTGIDPIAYKLTQPATHERNHVAQPRTVNPGLCAMTIEFHCEFLRQDARTSFTYFGLKGGQPEACQAAYAARAKPG